MTQIKETDTIEEGDIVYYIPNHLDKTPENAERGVVKTVREDGSIFVKYIGNSTGAKTPRNLLYR